MSEGGERKQQQQQQQQHYGTFQGVPNPCYQPSVGFPQPIPPPPGFAPPPSAPPYYSHGYQAIPVYAVVDGLPMRERRLPCCGLGIGWFLFIIGFFLPAIPWYAGAVILMCFPVDYREKPGFVACTIAAILAAIAVPVSVTKATNAW